MVEGIIRRIKPKNEVWTLRINGEETIKFKTKNKRERKMLSAIRKIMIAYDIDSVDLTNRTKYIKNLNVSQEKLKRMKANNKFVEKGNF